MNKVEIRRLYDEDQRKAVEYPDQRREVGPYFVRQVDTSQTGRGAILYTLLDESTVEAAIHEQVGYFESIRQDFEWKVYDHDQPSDLKDRLRAHGFEVEEAEAIMVLDLEEAPALLWQPVRHDVRRILRPEELADVMSVERQVWNEDFLHLEHYLVAMLSRYSEQMSVYMACVEGRPASAAWTYFPAHSQFASLWGGSTLEGFRKQGLYTALLSVRAQEARTRNVRYLVVDASPMSRPILVKFGFELISYSYPCIRRCKPAEAAATT